jgi:hypothetical protein
LVATHFVVPSFIVRVNITTGLAAVFFDGIVFGGRATSVVLFSASGDVIATEGRFLGSGLSGLVAIGLLLAALGGLVAVFAYATALRTMTIVRTTAVFGVVHFARLHAGIPHLRVVGTALFVISVHLVFVFTIDVLHHLRHLTVLSAFLFTADACFFHVSKVLFWELVFKIRNRPSVVPTTRAFGEVCRV